MLVLWMFDSNFSKNCIGKFVYVLFYRKRSWPMVFGLEKWSWLMWCWSSTLQSWRYHAPERHWLHKNVQWYVKLHYFPNNLSLFYLNLKLFPKGGNLDFTTRVIGACFFEKGLKVCQTKDFHFKQIFCKSKKNWATFQTLFIYVKPQKIYF